MFKTASLTSAVKLYSFCTMLLAESELNLKNYFFVGFLEYMLVSDFMRLLTANISSQNETIFSIRICGHSGRLSAVSRVLHSPP